MPQKIAFFCWESLHAVRVGGLAPAATELAESLASRGHEVHYFTRAAPATVGDSALIDGVHYHFCRPDGENIVEYCRVMSEEMVEAFRAVDDPPFDVLHFHDWHPVEAMHLLQDRVTVFSYHSTEYGRNGGNFGDWWEFGEISGKEWHGGYISTLVMTVSHQIRTELMWLYNVPEWKCTVVPNGVRPERFRKAVDPGAVKRHYGIHPLAPLVLYVGRLVYQKGPDLLIEAVPRILQKRWDVQFIVGGTGQMEAELREQARGLPVQFLGYILGEAHLDLLNAADVVVIPSRNEPFGLVLTEAWSAGRCVVATDVGGLGENIEPFVDGIPVPVQPESIAWGVNYVIDDPQFIRALGRAGRKKVLARFDWALVTDAALEVYDRAKALKILQGT